MAHSKWTKRRPREYSRRANGFIAVVFAAPQGYYWAWAVWHETGRDAGVELTFRHAKAMADEVIEKIVEAK